MSVVIALFRIHSFDDISIRLPVISDKTPDVRVAVDSVLLDSIISADTAEIIGIKPKTFTQKIEFRGMKMKCFDATIQVPFSDEVLPFNLPVKVVDKEGYEYNFLGRRGLFEKYKVEFDIPNLKINIVGDVRQTHAAP